MHFEVYKIIDIENCHRFVFTITWKEYERNWLSLFSFEKAPALHQTSFLFSYFQSLIRSIILVLFSPALIAEVILYSEGFESSKNLARKMVQMYRLCSEQLSQQDHYDFGMRAVKSVLVMAGALKRGNPNLNEDIVLIRALRDSNLPKFLKQDAELFRVSCFGRFIRYIQ